MSKSSYHHPHLKETLIAVTKEVIERDGDQAVTMNGIAKICGVSVAAPYRHFEDKEELLGAVCAEAFEMLIQQMRASQDENDSARDRVIAVMTTYVNFALEHPNLYDIMLNRNYRNSPWRIAEDAIEDARWLAGELTNKMDPSAAFRRLWGAAHGLAWLRICGMEDFREGDSPERVREDIEGVVDSFAA